MAAAQQNGSFALQFASKELCANREIVMAAVQQNGWALQYASEKLKNDHEIMMAAKEWHRQQKGKG